MSSMLHGSKVRKWTSDEAIDYSLSWLDTLKSAAEYSPERANPRR